MTPYNKAGRVHRLTYNELFDVGNIDPDGSIVDLSSPRGEANKVFHPSPTSDKDKKPQAETDLSRGMPSFTPTPASTLGGLGTPCYLPTSSLLLALVARLPLPT